MSALNAYSRGVARAARIIASSDPYCLRKSKSIAAQEHIIGEAWKSTGKAVSQSIRAVGTQAKK